jgi:hypothetical protein
MRIKQLLNVEIVGNAYHDSGLLNDLAHFALDRNNPIDERAAAIRQIDVVMGADPDSEKDNELLVNRYVCETRIVFGEDFKIYYPNA